jgi:CBS domain-containing protein
MKVQELMTIDVQCCEPGDDLAQVAQIMWDQDCGVVPVVEAFGRVAGVITDRDLCMAAWSRGAALAALRVADTMSREVSGCSPLDEIEAALSTMRRVGVRRLPVLDERGALVGILSLNDVVVEAERQRERGSRDLPAAEIASNLAAVSKPRKPHTKAGERSSGGPRPERTRAEPVGAGASGRRGDSRPLS